MAQDHMKDHFIQKFRPGSLLVCALWFMVACCGFTLHIANLKIRKCGKTIEVEIFSICHALAHALYELVSPKQENCN